MPHGDGQTARDSVPADFRFPRERNAVSIPEIAAKWGCSTRQVVAILNAEKADALNVSARRGDHETVRTHHRIAISSYYGITAKRVSQRIGDGDDGATPTLFSLDDFI